MAVDLNSELETRGLDFRNDWTEHLALQKEKEEVRVALKEHDPSMYELVLKLDEPLGLETYHGFQEAVDQKVQEIQALEGPLYTPEGKRAAIQEAVKELADAYIAEEKQKNEFRKEARQVLESNVNEAIADEELSNTQMEKMDPIRAKLKTDLAFVRNVDDLQRICREMLDRGEHNPAVMKFASMYGYMFMDKAKELVDGQALHQLQSYLEAFVEETTRKSYTPATYAKKKLKKSYESVPLRFAGNAASVRLIEKHRDEYVRKYS